VKQLAALALVAILAGPVLAQETPGGVDDAPAPPYEESLLRLSEILGALHYLRGLCGDDEGELWREQMQALIDAENAPFVRRVRLADAFNRGYESYRSVHLRCTPAARITVSRFVDEGARLAGEIVARYGDDS